MEKEFHPISLDGQEEYNRLFAMCSQKPSDYSFINLWGWGLEYGLEWSFRDGYVLLRQTIPQTLYWALSGTGRRRTGACCSGACRSDVASSAFPKGSSSYGKSR